jgi:alcohol dehydrogenase class IV
MVSKYSQGAPVYFGEGAIHELGERVKELGCKKVMCVYDAGVKAAGAGTKAEESLKAAGIDYLVYDKITGEPADYYVNECGTMAKEAGVDCFVGIGGGSSMDCAKASALLIENPAPIEQYFTAPPTFIHTNIPIILVPTTSGTGSECSPMCIITSGGEKLSVFTNTRLAIIDPELTYTVPPSVTANTGLDAFTHAAEAITARNYNPHSELVGKAAIEKITKYLPIAVADGTNAEARRELALAANWAGIAFADTDAHLGHCLADSISKYFHSPHGYNCICVTPEVMRAAAKEVPEKVKIVGEAAGAKFDGNETPEEIGAKTATAIDVLRKACGYKGPKEYNMDRDTFLGMTAHTLTIDLGLRINYPGEVTPELCDEILKNSYDNYD